MTWEMVAAVLVGSILGTFAGLCLFRAVVFLVDVIQDAWIGIRGPRR